MRLAAATAAWAALLLSACAAPKPSYPPPPFAAEPAPAPKKPNFELVVSETVPTPEQDGLSFTRLVADGADRGQTPVGRKSETRTLSVELPAGNLPIRLEQWVLNGADWKRLDDPLQPRERFVRIEPGTVARLRLHFAEGEASNSLTLERVPAQ